MRPAFSAASVFLSASIFALFGCSTALVPTSASTLSVTGNWQLASTAAAASKLPSFSGELTGSGASITGIVHASSAAACVAPTVAIDVKGVADAQNKLTLTGTLPDGGVLNVTGTLAATGKSMSDATYGVTGGACAFPARAAATTATEFAPISGNYNGSFADASGPVLDITATLTQTPASDTSGNFQLSGSAMFGANPCFSSPVSVSGSQVTGGSFSVTYADSVTQNSVTAAGTFSPDGTMLQVTGWTLTGSCGPDNGVGTMAKQ